MSKRGVVYYNTGNKMIVRLAVSLHTLRKHYDGPCTILSEGEASHAACNAIAEKYQADCRHIKMMKATEECKKNVAYLNACLINDHTPYDTTMWIDSDTTIHGTFEEMFDAAEEHDFAISQFSDWRTSGKIGKRIRNWEGILPDHWIERALEFGPAINCGVFAFKKDTALVRDWYNLAKQGQYTMIPDETCCQVMLAQPEYKNKIMPQYFNCSCKYGERWINQAKIVHYHGRKHCRFDNGEPQFHSNFWYNQFEEIRDWWVIKDYKSKDRMLRKGLMEWDRWK